MPKILKITDRYGNVIDTVYSYGNDLKYGWTLNDVDTLEVSFSLTSPKCTEQLVKFANHIEVIDQDTGITVWGGIIFGHNFDDPTLKLNALDYNSIFRSKRLRSKQYSEMKYGDLVKQIILDYASESGEGISLSGFEIDANTIKTTRLVKSTDFLWDKIKELGNDANYDYWVDQSRIFHFASRRGSDKEYTLEYGGECDNITVKPTFAEDIMSLENSVYAETDGDTPLTCKVDDANSQNEYGLFEGTYSPNSGITDQSTLNAQTQGELQRNCYPADNITLTIKDSSLCPFDDLEVGDRVEVHLIPYFNFDANVRILRMVHTESTGLREITAGNIIFKPKVASKRLYKR